MEASKPRFSLLESLLSSQPKRLWRRYVIAIAIIISLLLGSHIAHITTLKEAAQDAGIINVSGRQRMLSQRVLFLASDLASQDGLHTASLLDDAIKQFEDAHQIIAEYASKSLAMSSFYAIGTDHGLDHASLEFIDLSRRVLTERGQVQDSVDQLREFGAFKLLRDLNQAVELFEAQAEVRAQNLRSIQEATLFLAILTILVEGILIFWPAQLSINRAIAGLDRRNQEILETNKELSDLAERMTHAASHDSLTGVANRKKLEQELATRIKQTEKTKSVLCLMHIDLDRFKEVNDTLGHQIGDRVIQHCANIMALTIRDDDLVARVGGDEFIVVLDLPENGKARKATEIANSLIKRISDPFELSGNAISVGASIGIAFKTPADDPMSLIGNADIALYEAKNNGRGISCIFSNEMRQEMEYRHTLSQDLRVAAEGDQFVPYLQPQIQFSDGRLSGFESLARWNHPLRGILTPDKFIDMARELGVIHLVDMQITSKSLEMLVGLRRNGWEIPKMSVNLDAVTLRQPNLCEWLSAELAKNGVEPCDLIVEITEAVLIEGDDDPAVETLKELRANGISLYLDDFGTGYSSLSYLSILDLNGLKIDRSLVKDPSEKRAEQIIRAVSSIAEGLELKVVAEGIEDPKQFSALQRLNCDVAQGFGIGRPLPIKDVENWLNSYGKNEPSVTIRPQSC